MTNEELAERLLSLTPDELLNKIFLARTVHGDKSEMLRVFILAYRTVCEERLNVALGAS